MANDADNTYNIQKQKEEENKKANKQTSSFREPSVKPSVNLPSTFRQLTPLREKHHHKYKGKTSKPSPNRSHQIIILPPVLFIVKGVFIDIHIRIYFFVFLSSPEISTSLDLIINGLFSSCEESPISSLVS